MQTISDVDVKAFLIPFPIESFSKPVLISPKGTTIGRDPNDTIQLVHKEVSRKHASIVLENGLFFIEDMGSRNGTFLNQKRIKKAQLKSHDKITIGDRTFLFLSQSGALQDLLLDPSISATDTIAISADEIELSELWAQQAETATRGFFQQAEDDSQEIAQTAYPASKRISQLYQLSEKLRGVKDPGTVLNKGLDLIMDAIPAADCALVMLKSVSEDSIEVKAFKKRKTKAKDDAIHISRTMLDWVLSEKVALISQNINNDQRFRASDSIRIQNVQSIICVPMMREEDVIGVLYAGSSTILSSIIQEDAVFAAAVANELALNINNIRLQKEALRNERMAAIGLTVTDLAHNIRNLITLNQNAVDLMQMRIKRIEDPQLNKNWQWIQQSFSEINKLSTDMLEYTKEDELDLKMTDINRMILRYRKTFEENLSREGIAFEFSLSKENPKWMMDEKLFQRAFFNLVTNAIHAVKNRTKGQIIITTSVESNKYLVIGVGDNGCGIGAKTKSRIFDLFFTTKGTMGTGLGLPMVQKFVEKSGGRLEFESEEGAGSVFKMVFPKDMKMI